MGTSLCFRKPDIDKGYARKKINYHIFEGMETRWPVLAGNLLCP